MATWLERLLNRSPPPWEDWRPEIKGWSSDILPWYDAQARALPDGAVVIEVGVFHGRSVLFLAERLWALGKTACVLFAVDSWAWNENDYPTFQTNLFANMTRARVIPLQASSLAAAEQLGHVRADLVFIDAGHDYASVRADLAAWEPRVKRGGLLSGHDYVHEGPHAGVGQAVDERFPHVKATHTVWHVRL